MTRKANRHMWQGLSALLVVLSLSRGVALAAGGMNVSQEADANYSYVGGVATHGLGKNVGSVSEQAGDVKYVFSPQITKDLLLRFGFEWQRFSFGVPGRAALPDALQQISAVLGADYEAGQQWLVRVEAQPGVYSDFSDVDGRDFDAPVVLGGVYLVDADVQWTIGLRIDPRGQYPVLPGVGVRWKFADEWTLDLMPPRPRLEYDATDKLQVYLGADIEAGTYRVGETFGTDHAQPKLDGALVDFLEVRVGPGVSWKALPGLTVEAEAGCMPYRCFEFFHESVVFRSYAAPYGQIACHARF